MEKKFIIIHIGYSEKCILDTIQSFNSEFEEGSISSVHPVLASGIIQAMVTQFEDNLRISGHSLADYWNSLSGCHLREKIDRFVLRCRSVMLYNVDSPDRFN